MRADAKEPPSERSRILGTAQAKNDGSLMRSFISIVFVLLMLKTQLLALQSPADLRNRIAGFPSSSLVEVRTKGGEKLRGHITNRTDVDFSLRQDKGTGAQTIAYEQVLSIALVDAHTKKKWIAIAVGLGGLLVVAIVVYNHLPKD